MNPPPLPTIISLPTPCDPRWTSNYNRSECHIVRFGGNPSALWVRALSPPQRRHERGQKFGLSQIRPDLEEIWNQAPAHPHVSQAGFATALGLEDPQTREPTVVLVTRYCQRGNILDRRVRNVAKAQKIYWLRQLCEGVQYLHDSGVIHGNIHPNNALIRDDGTACLADAGLYTLQSKYGLVDSSTAPGTIACKTAVMARNLETEDEPVEPTEDDDIFALGVLIWMVFMGKEPWQKKTQAIRRVSANGHQDLPRPEDMGSGLWTLLQNIFLRPTTIDPRALQQIRGELIEMQANSQEVDRLPRASSSDELSEVLGNCPLCSKILRGLSNK